MFRCVLCGHDSPPLAWSCELCGGVLDQDAAEPSGALAVGSGAAERFAGFWRYSDWLPQVEPLSLGEPTTPLVAAPWLGEGVFVKLEGCLPTGSFKDRGSAVLTSWLRQHGATAAIIDSSGNAGASLAAYCARAGLACHVFVPQSASPIKMSQIEAYGASIHPISGSRQDVADAARLSTEGCYASHAWHPLFLAGTQTLAYETCEQLQGDVPDTVVMPVGAGTLLLGAARGFAALRSAGTTTTMPRIFGIQSVACAPLAAAWAEGRSDPKPIEPGTTAAEGIRIANPPRGSQILAAVRESDGAIVTVTDEEIWRAHRVLAGNGLYVEPTSAVALAGLRKLRATGTVGASGTVLLPLTATGLKTPTKP